jgi:hypothetical protein
VRRAERRDFRGLLETPARLRLIERRAGSGDRALTGNGAGEGRDEAEDDVELEDRDDVARREGELGLD